MHLPKWREWSGAIVTVVALASVALASEGCQPASEHRDTSVAGPDTMRKPRTLAPAKSELVAQAESVYNYGRERPQLEVNDRDFPGPYVADDSLPRMWIATATVKPGVRRPPQRIVARIRSERAYPKAGIDSGYNYVWRSSWDAKDARSWVTKIVSGSSRFDPYVLTRDPRKREYTHGNAREPRLVRVKVHSVAFGACFDDPICPTGHCGYYD